MEISVLPYKQETPGEKLKVILENPYHKKDETVYGSKPYLNEEYL